MNRLLFALLLLAGEASAQSTYGAKGIYPVYETAGQWLIFDRAEKTGPASKLAVGKRFLVVGTEGAQVFEVARASAAYGGACRERRPVALPTALLKGPRSLVGRPIIGISVAADFSLKGSQASYTVLANEVDDSAYKSLIEPLRESAMADAKAGGFPFKHEDAAGQQFLQTPDPQAVQTKIDFGARVAVKGLKAAYAFVEETQIAGTLRRCVRLADGGVLAGVCAPMPRPLMAETDLLRFVSYDPSGSGGPLLLAFTPTQPLWGDERWAFALTAAGPRRVMMDAMDVACREAF